MIIGFHQITHPPLAKWRTVTFGDHTTNLRDSGERHMETPTADEGLNVPYWRYSGSSRVHIKQRDGFNDRLMDTWGRCTIIRPSNKSLGLTWLRSPFFTCLRNIHGAIQDVGKGRKLWSSFFISTYPWKRRYVRKNSKSIHWHHTFLAHHQQHKVFHRTNAAFSTVWT